MQTYPAFRTTLSGIDQEAVVRLAEAFAVKARAGDVIALVGDLGAGKTTFARAFIRAVLGDPEAEVPSPTFSLVQLYDHPRFVVAHADLYRLSSEDEARELGLGDLATSGVVLVEWPERAPSLIGGDTISIAFSEDANPDTRSVEVVARGGAAERTARAVAIAAFLSTRPPWHAARMTYLQGDASVRAYARLSGGPSPALLMDWPEQPDGPAVRDGLPYSRIAHLAEGTRAFDAIAGLLFEAGARAPRILERDHESGLLLIDDLGDRVFGSEVAGGADIEPLWRAATLALVHLRQLDGARLAAWNARPDSIWRIPAMDRAALEIECDLLIDWYWPFVKGEPVPQAARRDFRAAWAPVFDRLLSASQGLALRDYHSPNLLWLGDTPPTNDLDVAASVAAVGIIDFQDALIAHPAYDLVSLLQDARLDVPPDVEAQCLDHYVAETLVREPDFDAPGFRAAYAALGAQRNTKILGIFARLNDRDGKPQYLRHIPRLWRYLERDLRDPGLESVRLWFDANFPPELRTRRDNAL